MKFALFASLFISTLTQSQIIRGRFSHVSDNKIYITYSSIFRKTFDTIRLKEDGSFSKKFEINEQGKLYLYTNDNVFFDLIISPGYNLLVNADAASQEKFNRTLQITGKGSEVNVGVLIDNTERIKQVGWDDYKLPPDSFINSANEWRFVKDSLRKVLVKSKAKKPLLKDVVHFLRTDSLDDLYLIVRASQNYLENSIKTTSGKDSFFRKNIEPFIIPTNDEDYLAADYFKGAWETYIINTYQQKLMSKDSLLIKNKSWMRYRFEETEMLTSGVLSELLFCSLFKDDLPFAYTYQDEKEFSLFDSLFEQYKKKISSQAVLLYSQIEINKNKDIRYKTKTGNPAPPFSVTDSSGKIYTLNDFRGKLVYLDIWASWCIPCVEEIPDLKKLTDKFNENNNDIIFASISIDEKKRDWIEKGIKRHTLSGLQLWAGDLAWKSEFAKSYYISGVPHFILIDRDGRFIKYNADRPSSGKTIEDIIAVALNK